MFHRLPLIDRISLLWQKTVSAEFSTENQDFIVKETPQSSLLKVLTSDGTASGNPSVLSESPAQAQAQESPLESLLTEENLLTNEPQLGEAEETKSVDLAQQLSQSCWIMTD